MAIDAFDLAEQFQTPIFVMIRSRSGHEQLDVGSLRVSRQADRSRQGADRRRSEARQFGPLPRRGRRRHRLSHAARHGIRRCLFHARQRPQRKAQYSERPDDYVEQHGSSGAQVRDGRASTCRKPEIEQVARRKDRLHRLRHHALGDHREPRISCARKPTSRRQLLPAAGVSLHQRSVEFFEKHDRVYVVEQNRDGQMAS